MARDRDPQLRCPYCHRHLARNKGEYVEAKCCPSCGSPLPRPGRHGFDAMMHGAALVGRACPLEIIAALAATAGAMQAFIR